jgi:tetratricopeptide (TPR) repeat protein
LKERRPNTILTPVLPKNLRTLWTETSPDKAIARAQRLLEKGRPDSAVAALQDAIDAGGEDPRLRMELSKILMTLGQAREAAEGFKGALKSLPDMRHQLAELVEWARANQHEAEPLHEVLAEHHVSRRDFTAAFDSLEKVGKDRLRALLESRLVNLSRFLSKGPDQSIPRSALPLTYFAALVYEALGEDRKAMESYRRIVENHPTEMETVERRLRGVVARHFRSAPLRASLAEIYLSAGQEERAVEQFVEMVDLDSETAPRAAAALDELADKLPEPSAALWGLVKVRRSAGAVPELIHAAGRLIATGKHLDELHDLLEKFTLEGKHDPRLQLLIGETAQRGGKIGRSIAAFTSAARHPSAQVRGLAREALERMLESHSEESRLLEALADIAVQEGRTDEAVQHLDGLAKVSEEQGAVARRLQSILLSDPENDKAEALMERLASELDDPGLPAAFLRRRLRRGAEELPGARQAIASLKARHPGDPRVRLAAAEAKAASDEMKGAWTELKPLLDSTTGPDPTLLHLMVLIGSSSLELCREISERFFTVAPALAGSPEGQFALGEMAARSGDMAAAAEAFRGAASFSPAAAAEVIESIRTTSRLADSSDALLALVDLLIDSGEFVKAAEILSQSESIAGVPAPVMAKLQKAFRADPENSDLRIAMAAALAAGGNAAHARRLIEDGIRRAGGAAPPSLHLAAGDAWLREGNVTESVRSYSRAMAQEKTLAGQVGRHLERVLAVDVGHAGAHLALGRSRLLDDRSRDGVNALLTAWSIRPALGGAILKDLAYAAHSFPLEPQVDLARAQILLGQGEVEASSDALGAALRTSPGIAPEVLVRLQAIVKGHPSCARAHLHAARAWRIQGRCGEASKAFLAAAETDAGLMEQAMVGLADLMKTFPTEPFPHTARARLEEARGQVAEAADAIQAAMDRGAPDEGILENLRRLAAVEGPGQGRALLALGRGCRISGIPDEAAAAMEKAAMVAPDLLPRIREEVAELVKEIAGSPEARLASARLALASLSPEEALEEGERLFDLTPASWRQITDLAVEIDEAGGDPTRCAWLRARAFVAGGDYDAAANLLQERIPECDSDLKGKMCLLAARVERRRGGRELAERFMSEAASLAPDREEFLNTIHEETVASARSAARTHSTTSDLWRALRASLDLGDAEGAGRIGALLGLEASARGTGAEPDRQAAREALAAIACLEGRYGSAAELLEDSPASPLRVFALRRAGRLMEAAVCLEETESPAGGMQQSARDLYRRLAAEEFLGEPGCLEAETTLEFSGPLGSEGSKGDE